MGTAAGEADTVADKPGQPDPESPVRHRRNPRAAGSKRAEWRSSPPLPPKHAQNTMQNTRIYPMSTAAACYDPGIQGIQAAPHRPFE